MPNPLHDRFITIAVKKSAEDFPQALRDFVNSTKSQSVSRVNALHLLMHIGQAMSQDYQEWAGNPCANEKQSAGQIFKAAFCFQAAYHLSNNKSKMRVDAAKHFNDAMIYVRKIRYGRNRLGIPLPLEKRLGPQPDND